MATRTRTRPDVTENGTETAAAPTRSRESIEIPEATVVRAADVPQFASDARLTGVADSLTRLAPGEYLSFPTSGRPFAEKLRTRLQTGLRSRGLTLSTRIASDGNTLYVQLKPPGTPKPEDLDAGTDPDTV